MSWINWSLLVRFLVLALFLLLFVSVCSFFCWIRCCVAVQPTVAHTIIVHAHAGVDHMIVFTAAEDPTIPGSSSSNSTTGRIRILQRTYHVQLKKNPDANVAAPAAYLTSCGPDLDFVLRRTAWADLERYRAARQQPGGSGKKSKSTKKKNQSTNVFGETIGRLHLAAQDVDRMGGRKAKALRRAEQTERNEELQAVEADLEREKEQEAAAATGPTAAVTASKESSNAPSKTKTQ